MGASGAGFPTYHQWDVVGRRVILLNASCYCLERAPHISHTEFVEETPCFFHPEWRAGDMGQNQNRVKTGNLRRFGVSHIVKSGGQEYNWLDSSGENVDAQGWVRTKRRRLFHVKGNGDIADLQ